MRRAAILISILCMAVLILCGCAQSSADQSGQQAQTETQQAQSASDADGPEDEVDTGADLGLEGEWTDSQGGRAVMNITKGEDGIYKVKIFWGVSASEQMSWDFSGTYDEEEGVLEYTDGVKVRTVTKEDGSAESASTMYQEGSGSLTLTEDEIHWQDDSEDAGSSCVFVRMD